MITLVPIGETERSALETIRQSLTEAFGQRALVEDGKEAVHELGHTYGLKHCPNPACVMHFSNSLHDTDLKGWKFCPNCQRKRLGAREAFSE